MGEYSWAAVVAAVLVVLYELVWCRTGIFRDVRYWLTMAICVAFMIPVNGWYTKLSAPIVLYDPGAITEVRIPWDIPVEDFVFAFSLLTLSLVRWVARDSTADRPGPGEVDAG